MWAVGTGFGYLRTRKWPISMRWTFWLGSPLIALLHWKRALKHYFRAGRAAGYSWASVPAMLVLAVAWGVGEGIGACLSEEKVARCITFEESRPLRQDEVAGVYEL
jgi:hypothetical protein